MSEAQSEAVSEMLVTVKPERASPMLAPESSTTRRLCLVAARRRGRSSACSGCFAGCYGRQNELAVVSLVLSAEVEEREGSAYEEDGDLAHDEDDEDEDDVGSLVKSKKPREKRPGPRQNWSAAEDEALWRGD